MGQPMTSLGEHILMPIEERKKAFITHENRTKGNSAITIQTQTQIWKSMPSVNRTNAPPPLPLVGAHYPSRPEDIFVEQPFKELKETFEQKTKQHFLLDNFPPPPRRSSSMSSVSSLSPASSTTNESMIVEPAPTLSKTSTPTTQVSESTPAMIKPNAPVVYRWDDESN